MSFVLPVSLPAPTSTVTRNGKGAYGQTQRDVTTTWVLNPEATGTKHDEVTVVTLTTSHWGESRCYSSHLTWQTKHTDGAFAVSTWGSDHASWRPLSTRCARHSLAAMQAHHAEALALTESLFAEQPRAVFAEAALRTGLLTESLTTTEA